MKNLKFFTLAIAILGFTATSFSQNTASVINSEAAATIHEAISLANTTALNFGGIVSSANGGTVKLDAATGVRIATGVTIPEGLKGEVAAGLFTVSGHNNAKYNITIPTAPISISSPISSPAPDGPDSNTMTVSDFTSTKTSGTITSGTDTFSVGATLNVGANQAAGSYTGTYTVTVTYQ